MCGDQWDCDENLRQIVMMCSFGFIAFFSLLAGTCMYISKVRGNAYRKKFARVILKKERELETQKNMVGVSILNLKGLCLILEQILSPVVVFGC